MFRNQVYEMAINASLFISVLSIFLIGGQRNPVFSVFSFLLTIVAIMVFLLFIGAEFFALLILIIYIGVITVLFLFVVIMYNLRDLDISIKVFKVTNVPYFFFLVGKGAFMSYFFLFSLDSLFTFYYDTNIFDFFTLDLGYCTVLFNSYYLILFLCGILMFIAMVGSVALTYPFYR